jgi:hypothetical protein
MSRPALSQWLHRKLATGLGLVMFMREQLGKPVPSPVVLGQLSENFREAVTNLAEREWIPVYQFRHKERIWPRCSAASLKPAS